MSHIKGISLGFLLVSSILSIYYHLEYDLHLMNYDYTERGIENYESLITYSLYFIIVSGITISIILYYKTELFNILFIFPLLSIGLLIYIIIFTFQITNQIGLTPSDYMIEKFSVIDKFIISVDKIFCSNECACNLWNTAPFMYAFSVEYYYREWNKTINKAGAISFLTCPQEIIEKTYKEFEINFNSELNKFKLSVEDMSYYFKHVEKEIKCTGFYRSSYHNGDINTILFKYLFTDVNRAIPYRIGCIESINDWINATLEISRLYMILIIVSISTFLILFLIWKLCIKRIIINNVSKEEFISELEKM